MPLGRRPQGRRRSIRSGCLSRSADKVRATPLGAAQELVAMWTRVGRVSKAKQPRSVFVRHICQCIAAIVSEIVPYEYLLVCREAHR